MNNRSEPIVPQHLAKVVFTAVAMLFCLAVGFCFYWDTCSILSPDRQGYRFFTQDRYKEAADRFTDPMWKGTALFRAGDFIQASGVFSGFDSAEGIYNHGTCLVLQGKYDEAITRYERALELKSVWPEAENNLRIARFRAEMLRQKGGDMTGGMLGADEIVFTSGTSSPRDGQETVEEAQTMSDAEMRAMWLRNVQTKPADFLRAKFAYQQATRTTTPEQGTKSTSGQ